MGKLYPPSIDGTLPAFYSKQFEGTTTARIVVPFTMNKSVSKNDIGGFALKIKTIQTNTNIIIAKTYSDNSCFIGLLDEYNNEVVSSTTLDQNNNSYLFDNIFKNNSIYFNILTDKLRIGEFYKVQLAYLDKGNGNDIDTYEIGYYSTVGIIKYTSEPKIKINPLHEQCESWRENYSSEWGNECIFSSWSDIDTYYETYDIDINESFIMPTLSVVFGQYINENDNSEKPYLQKFSLYKKSLDDNEYSFIETSDWFLYDLNNEENNKYMFKTVFKRDYNFDYIINYTVKTINNIESNIFYIGYYQNPNLLQGLSLKTINNFENGYINLFFEKNNNFSFNPTTIQIYKIENSDDNWRLVTIKNFINQEQLLAWNFNDFLIEQGNTYQYYCLFITSNYTQYILSEEVIADFEDIFLYDGEKQLKIQYNPKISSFKTNYLEQKIDTIGSKYPFIFRNGNVEYKEFPISGLISYHIDNDEFFINTERDLGIKLTKNIKRLENPAEEDQIYTFETTNLTTNNIKAERIFKLKVLDWLNNGKIKLFKSPSEGNYLIRIMNTSLSPEDNLNRMLHSFSCTAYEVQDYNYENLINLNMI